MTRMCREAVIRSRKAEDLEGKRGLKVGERGRQTKEN
jgi:hypothetical protein